ncbi:hypothetical protein ACO03V_07170 [Microbacterium sp. HMH0099]|uniref:hypothetical protein n=1 Tax=Microbacterium sp. HMH0099 TaxID=3414026 RepID=UPI003BF6BDB2
MDDLHDARATRRTPTGWFLLFGAAGGVAGLLPWLASGPFLPLQNLGEGQDPSRPGPFVLLPYSQYSIITIIVLLVVGGVLAGVLARSRGARPGVGRSLATVAGLVVVQVAAVVQTAVTTRAVLQERDESAVYLLLLTAVAVLAAVVAAVACLLVAAAPRAGAGIGLMVGAAAAGSWLGVLLFPPFSYESPFSALIPMLTYVSPVLVGLAIAWTGVASVGRVIAALVGLGLVWLVPALTTAIASAAGTRVLARDLPGMAEYGISVFRSASTIPEIVAPPLVTAVVVAVAGLLVRGLLASRRRRAASPVPTAQG